MVMMDQLPSTITSAGGGGGAGGNTSQDPANAGGSGGGGHQPCSGSAKTGSWRCR